MAPPPLHYRRSFCDKCTPLSFRSITGTLRRKQKYQVDRYIYTQADICLYLMARVFCSWTPFRQYFLLWGHIISIVAAREWRLSRSLNAPHLVGGQSGFTARNSQDKSPQWRRKWEMFSPVGRQCVDNIALTLPPAK